MSEWVEKELRSNFARAIRAGHRAANTEPRATRVRYRALEDALRIELANAATITLPVKLIRVSIGLIWPDPCQEGKGLSHSFRAPNVEP